MSPELALEQNQADREYAEDQRAIDCPNGQLDALADMLSDHYTIHGVEVLLVAIRHLHHQATGELVTWERLSPAYQSGGFDWLDDDPF